MKSLASLWQYLTTPHPSIATIEEQGQSRLLASFTLAMIPIQLATVVLNLVGVLSNAVLLNSILLFLMVMGVFLLNRSGYYSQAAALLIIMLFLVVHTSLLDERRIAIFFILLLLLASGIFVSTRLTFVVYLTSVFLQIAFATFSPSEYRFDFVAPLLITIFGGPAVIVFIYFRYVMENMRRSQLVAANEQLTRSEDRWRSLVENLPDIVVELEPSGKIRYSNFISTALSDQDIIGSIITSYIEPAYRDLSQAKIAEAIATRQPVEFEAELTRPDGEKRWFANRLSPVVQNGKVETLLVISRDITERKKMDASLLELAVLKERVDVLQGLISGYSHDMKMPLATIDFSLSILESVDDTSQHQLELETIRNQSARLNVLIQNILTLSRLDQISELERTRLDLKTLLEALHRNLLPACRHKDINVSLDVPSQLPPILANELELDRAIANIAENAVAYTPAGGTVMIRAFPDGAQNVIEVIDTGIGIPVDELEHIFRPFYRVSGEPSKPRGTGLGLAIAKRILDMHQGAVSVESIVGKGSTFRIVLPFETADPASVK